jgi:hypothetical protein
VRDITNDKACFYLDFCIADKGANKDSVNSCTGANPGYRLTWLT